MSDSDTQPGVSRRRLFAAAGTAGALAAAAASLPRTALPEPPAAAPDTEPPAPAGYRLTAHIQRYYQTAKV
ncbi:MAG TPA: formate dehydrogenase [Ideonella sp.]|jgi:hypothetical protein|nr:formate dehydrogenase [Ideonella sp.]